ncbi:O-antigen ligase family protein [Janibacter sp. DB-40]|uniref:O-antigen ligase family protein n=1 Tax=Janibacter sp. DB-40 TaxID=3028808 RepID=UPI0024061681|nr:O-antigen ligase family protein [Janibacter sp. DB-40]
MRSSGGAGVVTVTGLVAAGAGAAALGWIAPQQPAAALALAITVLLLGISAVRPVTVPLVVLPLLYVAARTVYGGTDVSVSDIALAVGTLAALLFGRRPFSRPLRNLLWLTVVYQVATLFTVVANPYPANALDWLHSWVLVAGGLLVGWSVGREGAGPLGLKLMLAAAVVLATWVTGIGVLQALEGNLEPVYLPHGMHKNFLGTMLGTTALIAYIRPIWLNLGRRAGMTVFWWLVVGMGFTQSRQAIVALGVVLVILVLRTHTDRRRSRVVLLAIVPALLVVLTLVRDQIASGNVHNSFFTRVESFADALSIWQTQPLVGVGLRWWYTDRFSAGIQPPNAEMEVLTAAGLIGLIGFLALMVGSVAVLWRMPPTYGMLAVMVVLGRFVQGQMDLFWVAAQTSVPFVIAGVCLGACARHEQGDDGPGEPATAREDAQTAVGVGRP